MLSRSGRCSPFAIGLALLAWPVWLGMGCSSATPRSGSESAAREPLREGAGNACIVGMLIMLFGDPPPDRSAQPQRRYFVADSVGNTTELEIDAAVLRDAGGSAMLNGKRVKVSGTMISGGSGISVTSIERVGEGAASC